MMKTSGSNACKHWMLKKSETLCKSLLIIGVHQDQRRAMVLFSEAGELGMLSYRFGVCFKGPERYTAGTMYSSTP